MANLWVDGFEGYNTNISQAYPLSSGSVGAGGRGGGKRANIAKLGPLAIASGTQIIVGLALIGPGNVFQFDTAGQFPLVVNVDALGRIIGTFRPEGGGTNLFTVIPPMLLLGVWRYYECKFTIDDATHLSFEMRVDETVVVPMDTYTVTTMTPLTIVEIEVGSVSVGVIDDFYVNDDTGGSPDDDYWGDTRMYQLRPNGAGVASDWSPSPAVANYLNVDDLTTDDAATFNETDTVTDRDTFEYEDTGLPGGTVIRTVAVMTSAARLSDSGPREITSHVIHGASELTGGVHALSDTYYMEQFRVPLCPSTSAAWTPAQVDAAKGGYELTA